MSTYQAGSKLTSPTDTGIYLNGSAGFIIVKTNFSPWHMGGPACPPYSIIAAYNADSSYASPNSSGNKSYNFTYIYSNTSSGSIAIGMSSSGNLTVKSNVESGYPVRVTVLSVSY